MLTLTSKVNYSFNIFRHFSAPGVTYIYYFAGKLHQRLQNFHLEWNIIIRCQNFETGVTNTYMSAYLDHDPPRASQWVTDVCT